MFLLSVSITDIYSKSCTLSWFICFIWHYIRIFSYFYENNDQLQIIPENLRRLWGSLWGLAATRWAVRRWMITKNGQNSSFHWCWMKTRKPQKVICWGNQLFLNSMTCFLTRGRKTKFKFKEKSPKPWGVWELAAIHSATFDIFDLLLMMLRDYFRARRWRTGLSGSEKASLGLVPGMERG